MNIVIIEDERVVADDLEVSIKQLIDDLVNIVQLHSVKEAIEYFSHGTVPDLIFSDIQLGDGLSFEIFLKVKLTAPVIFCTAFDEYALAAFKSNGIDYILKPFSTKTLREGLSKYRQLKQVFLGTEHSKYDSIFQLLTERNKQTATSVLVYYQDKIIPVILDDIALFYLENDVTKLITFSGKVYYPNTKLDELEGISGVCFFRANRQFLVSRKAIKDVSNFFSRKLFLNLTVPFEKEIIVSKAKSPLFLQWLAKNG